MLTKQQSKLLSYINDAIAETGITPSFEEMKQALGLRSKSGIFRLICALEERGFIRRLLNRARAIEVLRPPGSERAIDDAYKCGYHTGYDLGFAAGKRALVDALWRELFGHDVRLVWAKLTADKRRPFESRADALMAELRGGRFEVREER